MITVYKVVADDYRSPFTHQPYMLAYNCKVVNAVPELIPLGYGITVFETAKQAFDWIAEVGKHGELRVLECTTKSTYPPKVPPLSKKVLMAPIEMFRIFAKGAKPDDYVGTWEQGTMMTNVLKPHKEIKRGS